MPFPFFFKHNGQIGADVAGWNLVGFGGITGIPPPELFKVPK